MYNSQAVDLSGRVVENTRKLIAAINDIKNDIVYNASQAAISAEVNGSEDLYNGVTGSEVLLVFTSITALDAFLTDNYHYTNLNKVR